MDHLTGPLGCKALICSALGASIQLKSCVSMGFSSAFIHSVSRDSNVKRCDWHRLSLRLQ